MILAIILIALGFNSVSANTNSIDHWESIVHSVDIWKYHVGKTEPGSDWNKLSFNDSSWLEGSGGIGYGDEDDNTIIERTISLYLRIKFNILDTSKVETAILHVDYDDAFIAYINGVEIARAGISGFPPSYNQVADSEHEAKMYSGGLPEEFVIEKDMLKSLLNQGENLLAVQIHNSSAMSSDLSSNIFLSVGINDSSHAYRSTPEWFDEPFQFNSSNLPIIVIDTEGRTIVHEPKIEAKMGIINNGEGKRNFITDPFNEYDGKIGIEYRGNASFRISDKKPYTFETRKDDGSNRNVEILGLPKENDFVLRAVYIDKTLMRDALAYYLYRSMGRWAPRTRHVELVLNGEYQGVYVLEEKIKPDKNRLNITKMEPSDTTGDALTGGYIWCVNRRWGDEEHNDLLFDSTEADGNPRFLEYPKPDEVMPQQLDYISRLEQEFCDVMAGHNYNVPFIGYDKYIDVSSFIDEIIIQELTGNSDAYSYSSYFHKDRWSKICAGPIWDFDQAFCNSTHHNGDRYDEWRIKIPDSGRPQFWDKLFGDKEIQKELKKKWTEYRNGALKTERIIAFIDSVANYLQEAQEHNFKKWPILGVPIWRSLPGAEERDTYQKEVDYMKEWLINRIEWMDEQLFQTTCVDNISGEKITEFKLYPNYPNPFNPSTSIKYQIAKYEKVTLKIYNTLGQEITTLVDDTQSPGVYEIKFDGSSLPSGVYFYRLQSESGYSKTRKLILMK